MQHISLLLLLWLKVLRKAIPLSFTFNDLAVLSGVLLSPMELEFCHKISLSLQPTGLSRISCISSCFYIFFQLLLVNLFLRRVNTAMLKADSWLKNHFRWCKNEARRVCVYKANTLIPVLYLQPPFPDFICLKWIKIYKVTYLIYFWSWETFKSFFS